MLQTVFGIEMKSLKCYYDQMQLQPTLTGKMVILRPLKTEDFEDLYLAASDPKIWEQHPSWDRYKREVFEGFFEAAMQSGGGFVIVDPVTDYIIGSTRYYDFDASKKQVMIGYTFLACEYWGHKFNKEAKALLLEHAFKFVDRVLFQIGKNNIRSQKAIAKIGAELLEEVELDGSPHLVFKIDR
jgi:RimJ/RimL family protein N-acetyltransferase